MAKAQTGNVIHTAKPGTFLSSRPEWSIHDACIGGPNQTEIQVTQAPFLWVEGAWQADVAVREKDTADPAPVVHLVIRISPDTLRRWREVGINPFLEACAQLRDHLRTARRARIGTLTLL